MNWFPSDWDSSSSPPPTNHAIVMATIWSSCQVPISLLSRRVRVNFLFGARQSDPPRPNQPLSWFWPRYGASCWSDPRRCFGKLWKRFWEEWRWAARSKEPVSLSWLQRDEAGSVLDIPAGLSNRRHVLIRTVDQSSFKMDRASVRLLLTCPLRLKLNFEELETGFIVCLTPVCLSPVCPLCVPVLVCPSVWEGQPEEHWERPEVGGELHAGGQQPGLHLLLQPAEEVRHTHVSLSLRCEADKLKQDMWSQTGPCLFRKVLTIGSHMFCPLFSHWTQQKKPRPERSSGS